jgi:acyl dehydratase
MVIDVTAAAKTSFGTFLGAGMMTVILVPFVMISNTVRC